MNDPVTAGQYRLVRVLLGAYLFAHFTMLLPWGAEVFAAGGSVRDAALSPYMGKLPNPLALLDSPAAVASLLALGALSGAALVAGRFDRTGALLAALVLGWLYQRNPLIANPSLPLLGFLLVLHLFVPRRAGDQHFGWRLPAHLWQAAWIVLAVAYTHSGITKLLSPSWTDGETIRLVLENPLARDHALRGWVLGTPPVVLQALTFAVLWVEVLFAPLALFRRLRPVMWTLMLGAQFGFLVFLDFADLTLPMLLAHLLTFDPRWLSRVETRTSAVLLFDGGCAFCHANVRFALAEDRHERLRFAPLDSAAGRRLRGDTPPDWTGDSIVLVDADGIAVKSRAVAGVLERLGGLWWLAGKLLRAVPRPLADLGYDLVGRVRHRLVLPDACPLLPASRVAR